MIPSKFLYLPVTIAIAAIATGFIGLEIASEVFAQSTSKSLATNFTLVNLGTTTATVFVNYFKADNGDGGGGGAWVADTVNTHFTIGPNGSQHIVRQYADAVMTTGKGSAIISSDQLLASVTQVVANYPGAPASQIASNGAYAGFSQTSDKFYAPLLSRRGTSASGTTNSQLMIQNVGNTNTTVQVRFLSTNSNHYTNTGIVISAGATYYYDLDSEANLNSPWFGSAVIETLPASGHLAVVANFFLGAHNLQTYNAFPASNLGTTWVVPLFVSRLAVNGLNTPVSIQNLSDSSMPSGSIQMNCIKDTNSPSGPATFTLTNTNVVTSYFTHIFNPVTDSFIQGDWFGACRISAPGNVVAFVQMRFVGSAADPGAAAYEAINASSTTTKVFIPLIAKRLCCGFATAATIVNLSQSQPATVTLTYSRGTGSPDASLLTANVVIPPGGSLIQNQRLVAFQVATAGDMVEGWFGTLSVQSTGTPIHGFVQLTNIGVPPGDTFMAHLAFAQ